FFLGGRGRGAQRQCRVHLPEYPPLVTLAGLAGFRPVQNEGPVPVALLSLPRNPEGLGWTSAELATWSEGARSTVIDETFREFVGRPSHAEAGTPGLWTTGALTKFFGGDAVRVGYAIAPPEEVEAFQRLHSIVLDDIPAFFAASALALLADREPIARRVRALFNRNRAALRQALPAVPSIDAPVYFDRAPDGDGDGLAQRCLRASVLVSPGSLFGDPTGVRICLTRPTFRRDLARYLAVRGGAVPAEPASEGVPIRAARPRRGATARA
ncbi:aspartate aminotransferase related protein, partial [mine drainage metagenome]